MLVLHIPTGAVEEGSGVGKLQGAYGVILRGSMAPTTIIMIPKVEVQISVKQKHNEIRALHFNAHTE